MPVPWPPSPPATAPGAPAVQRIQHHLDQFDITPETSILEHLAVLLELRVGARVLGLLTTEQARNLDLSAAVDYLGEATLDHIVQSEAADLAMEVVTCGPKKALRRPHAAARPIDER